MVIDNAPCHAAIEQVFLEKEFLNNHLLRLAPYCPMLNPIEYVWSNLKSGVKSDLTIQLPRILADEGRSKLTQTSTAARTYNSRKHN